MDKLVEIRNPKEYKWSLLQFQGRSRIIFGGCFYIIAAPKH
jgi:hypothetical protein